MNSVLIGEHTRIEDWVSISTLNWIKNNNTIAEVDIGDKVIINEGSSLISCTIKDGCIIGSNCVISEGCIIGENSIITNNSVVPPNTIIPDKTIYGGNPLKFIKNTNKADIINM